MLAVALQAATGRVPAPATADAPASETAAAAVAAAEPAVATSRQDDHVTNQAKVEQCRTSISAE
jgi:hypothetical protein